MIGLVEEEWMSTLSTVSYDEVNYESYVTAGKRLALELKNEQVDSFSQINSILSNLTTGIYCRIVISYLL